MNAIIGFTLAVVRMADMLEFYSRVFGIVYESFDDFGTTLYRGNWGNLDILFCPADVANNKATQNRHQLEVEVQDIHTAIALIKILKGELMGSIHETEAALSIGCYDPDRNSIVLKQRTK
ncbi:VOC family protein [Winogradskyella sp.]|uniref:VOC family protein n=1 Tax=Winogradskyella sp. TaxID=1883156 RepID=UPI003BA947F1